MFWWFLWFVFFWILEIRFFSQTNQKNQVFFTNPNPTKKAGATQARFPRWAPICRAFGASFTFVPLEHDLQWLWLVHPRVSQCWKVGGVLIRGPVQCIEESNIYLCFFCDFWWFWWFLLLCFFLFVERLKMFFFLWCIFFGKKNTHLFIFLYIHSERTLMEHYRHGCFWISLEGISWQMHMRNYECSFWWKEQKTQPLPLLILFKLHFGSYSCSKKTPETSRLPQNFRFLTAHMWLALCVRQWTLEATVAGASETLRRSWRGWDFPKKSGPKQGFWGVRCRPRGLQRWDVSLFFQFGNTYFFEKHQSEDVCKSLMSPTSNSLSEIEGILCIHHTHLMQKYPVIQ